MKYKYLIVLFIIFLFLILAQNVWQQKSDRRLSALNPIDHFRLLWWILVTPQKLIDYKKEWNVENIGKWLVSTLVWLPLLIPSLALGLEFLPMPNSYDAPTNYLWFSAGLFGCWLLVGWLPDLDEDLSLGVDLVFGMVIGVMIVMANIFAIEVVGGVVGIIALCLAFSFAFVVTSAVAFGVVFGLGVAKLAAMVGVVAFGLAVGMTLSDAGLFAGLIVIGVAGIVKVIVDESLKTGNPSRIARLAFFMLITAHLFLIYYCFFDGWKLFV